MDRHTFLDLIPAYALGALDADERADFEALLAEDGEAQTLLTEYQDLADSLVLTTAARPAPAHLGEDLKRRLAQHQNPSSASLNKPPAASLWTRWLSAAAILAAVFGLTFILAQLQPAQPSAWQQEGWDLYRRLQETENVLQAEVEPAEGFTQISGHLLANPADNSAVIRLNNLPALNDDQTYQLWLVTNDGVISSGGLYNEVIDGTMYVILPIDQPLDQYRNFGCSLEPEGGSPFPDRRSGPGVFRVQLAEA